MISVGSPQDLQVKKELSEPLDLTGLSLGRMNAVDPPGSKMRNPLNFGIDNSLELSAEVPVWTKKSKSQGSSSNIPNPPKRGNRLIREKELPLLYVSL